MLGYLFPGRYQVPQKFDFGRMAAQRSRSVHICRRLSRNQPYNTVPAHSDVATVPSFHWAEKNEELSFFILNSLPEIVTFFMNVIQSSELDYQLLENVKY
jgi:hypothetical protein